MTIGKYVGCGWVAPPGGREVGPHPGEAGDDVNGKSRTVKLPSYVEELVFGAPGQGYF